MKYKALRPFDGIEGRIKTGQVLELDDQRARELGALVQPVDGPRDEKQEDKPATKMENPPENKMEELPSTKAKRKSRAKAEPVVEVPVEAPDLTQSNEVEG